VCVVLMSCLGSLARLLPLGAGFVMTDILMPQAHTSWIPVTSGSCSLALVKRCPPIVTALL
jgi:hypothetical protein